MSHFKVIVVGANPEHELAPFHEVECTGVFDEFVVPMDLLPEARAAYDKDTCTVYIGPDGQLTRYADDSFYRDFTPEEEAAMGHKPMGSGCGSGMSWSSKDWGDGRGYRAKVFYMPEGWRKEERPTREVQSFRDFVIYQYDKENEAPLEGDAAPDMEDAHKWGWWRVDAAGEVTELVRRTNPNKKWDWYQAGGRYSNYLLHKGGTRVDQALKKDIDFAGMEKAAVFDAAQLYDKARLILDQHPAAVSFEALEETYPNIEQRREFYYKQPAVVALREGMKGPWHSPEDFAGTREDYLEAARLKSFSTFAFVKDRQWQEMGEMGWFGCVSDAKDESEWARTVRAFMDSLGDDELVTIIDCHI